MALHREWTICSVKLCPHLTSILGMRWAPLAPPCLGLAKGQPPCPTPNRAPSPIPISPYQAPGEEVSPPFPIPPHKKSDPSPSPTSGLRKGVPPLPTQTGAWGGGPFPRPTYQGPKEAWAPFF